MCTLKQKNIKIGIAIVITVFIIALLSSCTNEEKIQLQQEEIQSRNPQNDVNITPLNNPSYFIVEIKGCSYIVYKQENELNSNTSSGIVHQANCPNHN